MLRYMTGVATTETTQECFLCFCFRRCQQTHLQSISHIRRSAKGEPSGSQGPVSPYRVLTIAARGHPHSTPQSREASAIPPGAPPPLPTKTAAGLRHLCYSSGEATVQRSVCMGIMLYSPGKVMLLLLLPNISPSSLLWTLWLVEGCSDECSCAGSARGSQLLVAKLGSINKWCL